MKYISMLFLWFLAAASCWGQMTVDQRNHCTAVIEQARAQGDQLRIPNLVGGVTQPSSGTPAQTYIGIQNSIANDRKASDILLVAWKTCSLYDATESATLRIAYALPAIQKDALNHRAEIIDVMELRLDNIVNDAQSRVGAQNLSRVSLYSIQSARVRMELDRSTTQQSAALLSIPDDLSPTPLKYLLTDKQDAEIVSQEAAAKLQRAGNWDVQLESGVHHQLFSSTPTSPTIQTTSGTGLYGGVTFTWGLGNRAVDKHLAKTVDAYGQWKETQEGEVIKTAVALKEELISSMSALRAANLSLIAQQKVIDSNLELVKNSDTSAGLTFSYQLQADRLMLAIELEDTQYRLSSLQKYLDDNF